MLWIFLLVVLVAGMAFWLFASRRLFQNIEEGRYELIERRKLYELRDYESFIGSEVKLPGDILSASNQGFGILSEHLFPSKHSRLGVKEERASGETPFLHTIICARPKSSAEASSSIDHTRIKTVLYPGRVVAARSFSWYPTERRVSRYASLLESALIRDGFTLAGEPELVLYNAPFSPPFFLRSEILIEVKG